jgi:N-acetyl-gamma-glutamyl-phosphate reductase
MINVGVVGVSGYTGIELIKILINHQYFDIKYVANSTGDDKLTNIHPSLKNIYECDIQKAEPKDIADLVSLVFLALPHKTSMPFVKELISLGVKVVDLSADYRLSLENYEKYYCPHIDKENIPNSVYGLPEFYRDKIANTNLVANPGCYPTASLLAILPFVEYIKEGTSVFIDAKSGVSGAGKKLSETTHFVTINENIFAYSPFKHRHSPEISEKIELIQNRDIDINFVPHLLPVTRGMLISVYATIKDNIDANEVLENFYKNEDAIRVFNKPVDIKSSSGTNFCDIFATTNGNSLFISSSIDNLLRGASSQAVVNANIMCGLEENTAIPYIAYVP